MNDLFDFVTNDYVRTYVALAGFLISIINSICLIKSNSFKINLVARSYFVCSNLPDNPVCFEFAVENNSKLNISVSQMFLLINDEKYEFQWDKVCVRHRTRTINNKVTEEESIYSVALPYSISGMGVVGGYFYVKTNNETTKELLENSNVAIEIITNRGKKKFKLNMKKCFHRP